MRLAASRPFLLSLIVASTAMAIVATTPSHLAARASSQAAAPATPPGPVFSQTGPDADAYGQADRYPVGPADTYGEQRDLVGAFSHFAALFPHREVAAGDTPWPFQYAPNRPIRYPHAGRVHTLDDYLARLPITGLVIAKDGTILTERYQYGRTDRDLLTSQSMAKTIVAMLVGIAVDEKRIGSIDDPAGKYVTALGDSPYGQTSIRDLLHMSSGVSCPTDTSDSASPAHGAITPAALAACTRRAPAGKTFEYSATDAALLGLVARQAFGAPLAAVLHDRVWAPMGAEAAAEWTLDGAGEEIPFCCFNATLRDYARFGRLLANDGARDGHPLISRQWLVDATTMSERDPQLQPGRPAPFFGYGYQVWILPDERRMFCLLGANGQRIFVDPQSKLVMVQTAVETKDVDLDLDAETIALWLGLVAQFGR